jgi:hypothetical protein
VTFGCPGLARLFWAQARAQARLELENVARARLDRVGTLFELELKLVYFG